MILVDLGTPEGDKLTNYPDVVDERWLQMELLTCVGVHHLCGGFVDIRMTSETHSAIRCRHCGLRVTVPRSLTTVHSLREYTTPPPDGARCLRCSGPLFDDDEPCPSCCHRGCEDCK